MRDQSKQVDDDDRRTTAIGLARYAYEYIEAAIIIDAHHALTDPADFISPTPAYFLAHHGIELTLKAYLRHCGVRTSVLSTKYGHNLHAAHRKAKGLGLSALFEEEDADREAPHLLADINEKHSLRYIRTELKRYPLWAIVEPLAVRLHQAVAPAVGYRSFKKIYGA